MFKVAPADQAPADHHFDQQIEQLERDRALRNPAPRHLLFPEFGPGPLINHIREMVTVSFDRKSVVKGKSVSVRVNLGGRLIIKKKKNKYPLQQQYAYKKTI